MPVGIRLLIAAMWLGGAWWGTHNLVVRRIFSYLGGTLLIALLFTIAFDRSTGWLEKYNIVPRGSWVAGPLGFVVGIIPGLIVSHFAVKTSWLYWSIHVILAGGYVILPLTW